MTRSQLIARLAQRREALSRWDVETAVKTMLEHLAGHLANGGPHRDSRLRELLGALPPAPAREEPAHRGGGSEACGPRGAFQAGQGASRARGWAPRCGRWREDEAELRTG